MTLQINGESRHISRATNVLELLEEIGLPPHALLIEHNGLALHRDEWPHTTLSVNDRIEIIRIVAGG